VNAPVTFAFKAGSGVTGVAVTAGERIAAKTLFQIHFIITQNGITTFYWT